MTDNLEIIEQQISELRHAGRYTEAVTRVIEGYGPEVLGFLEASTPTPDDAQEILARTCERVFKGLARFEGRSTVRTWFYAIAINESRRLIASQKKGRFAQTLSSVTELVAPARTTTPIYCQSGPKQRFAELRATLSHDEQMLLILRVDRNLSWQEITHVLSNGHVEATIRKRFERIKVKLRQLAIAQGILDAV